MRKGEAVRRIGRRIAEARSDKKFSQTKLGEEVGVSRGAVGQWETGKTAPSTDNLSAAAVVLDFAFEWLATGRGPKRLSGATSSARDVRMVPFISWVSAGKLADAETQVPIERAKLIPVEGLGSGDFFALRVDGDSMDRISPDGSIIIVDRSKRDLEVGKPFIFRHVSEGTTFKLWQPDPDRLEPHSWNVANRSIFIKRQGDFEVIGRVRRTLLDL